MACRDVFEAPSESAVDMQPYIYTLHSCNKCSVLCADTANVVLLATPTCEASECLFFCAAQMYTLDCVANEALVTTVKHLFFAAS